MPERNTLNVKKCQKTNNPTIISFIQNFLFSIKKKFLDKYEKKTHPI